MAGNSRDPGRSVTARALGVLTAFDIGHTRLTLTEIARRSEIPLATAHRLVGELVQWGALNREGDGRYAVGLRLWEIGLLAPVHAELRRTALPYMQELYETTGENVHLAVRDGLEAVYVEKLTGRRSAPIISRSGGRLPLHSTGVGKVLLAHAPAPLVHEYCEQALLRHTPYTIVEPGRLGRELQAIRQRGFAQTSEEMTLGNCSVAVPIRDADGGVVASLGLVVHSVRAELPKLARPLLPAAEAIQQRMREHEHADSSD
ncbi:helix-turn-helix domain-containing protein [Allosaccharopolyspora coralli]|uniref:Helix-turn-helix domain-containing protein n=1 Tax=Allosaccharopolyspora coralli TaxID=2665642 RepID=A0A5Q3Q1K5_9PSEU|nr:IclR family transcriptional regulator [Allosaccharopolyspora coralli]QGK68213.1 helix-turn-helix domain-containing protein [Allosaccharopolyspora coralli]